MRKPQNITYEIRPFVMELRCRPIGIVVSDADCGAVGTGRRATSPLVWLVEGEERWEAPDHPQGFLPLNWVGTEQNCTVTCIVLKAKANDRRKNSCP
ncbi:uncharacterized protein TNCV_1613751 [Trichonephila clavipes]|nr:uncharacterized protein TNCV_1613751 [Trichonephila clavipes]